MLHKSADRTICLSLPKRTDRRDSFQKQADKIGLEFEFYDALSANEVNNPHFTTIKGSNFTHNHNSYAQNVAAANLLRKCLEDGVEVLLFIEDDCVFDDRLPEVWTKFVQEDYPNHFGERKKPFDLIYVGAWHTQPPERISTHLYGCTYAQMSHCVFIHQRAMPLIIEHCEQNKILFDILLADKVQPFKNSYCIMPNLAIQADNFSDMWGVEVKHQKRFNVK